MIIVLNTYIIFPLCTDIGSTSQTLSSHIETLFNTHPEQTTHILDENKKVREVKSGFYRCPKDIGLFIIEPGEKIIN
jgi:hypothetical protein